tara:strand:- start:17637 stop:19031 length:1395 start_codon:yes stop_codon:yes gene_type:complete
LSRLNSLTEKLSRKDKDFLFHPNTNLIAHQDSGPFILERGKGIYVFDTDGNKYIEGMAGLWCNALGHGNEELADAAMRQFKKFPYGNLFASKSHEPAIELAERLVKLSPFDKAKVFFGSSGSDANDTQIKLFWYINNALGKTRKKKFLSRIQAYHGVTLATSSLTGLPAIHGNFDLPQNNFSHVMSPNYFMNKLDGESEESFVERLGEDLEKHIIEQDPETIAAMFAEPVMGAGGVIIPPKKYFETINPILEKYDIPLIDDEVVCGFGRTGNLWGAETFGMRPASITVAKALSSSYLPISAVILDDEYFEIIAQKSNELGVFGHGYTYSGHPVSCAVANKTLEIYQRDNIVDHVNKVSPSFIQRLNKCDKFDLVGNVRGVGLIGALELVSEKNSNKGFDKKGIAGKIFDEYAKKNGLIIRAIGDIIALCPPLIINESQINDMFDIVEDTINKTTDVLSKQRLLK